MLLFCCAPTAANPLEGNSSRAVRVDAVERVPFNQMNPQIREQLRDVVEHPSYFRRMPTQQIECNPQMFKFLVRRPEVMVNIWELMGITKVSAKRLDPYSFFANDGVGTTCRCDLVFANEDLHIYYGDGTYDGTLAPREVTGRCVCVLRSQPARDAQGNEIITGTMDVFLRMDNLGADLLARSVGPFVGKTADYNFVETAKFISQICKVCQASPNVAYSLAMKLDNVDAQVKYEFANLASSLGQQAPFSYPTQVENRGSPADAFTPGASIPSQESLVRKAGKEAGSYSKSSSTSVHFSDVPRKTPTTVQRREDWSPVESGRAFSAPAAIQPRKPHIYMRR